MGCCLSCEKFNFGLHRTQEKMIMGVNNHEARTDPSVSVSENGIKIVTIPTVDLSVQDPTHNKSQDPSSSLNEQYISPSTHALSAAATQPLPPISETKEVMELHTGNYAGINGYRHEIDSFQHESYYSVNSNASPAHMPESGFFRPTPGRDARWWSRRESYTGEHCPTPLHEGSSDYNNNRIYTSQFASLFSDENPNACSIV